MTAEDMADTLGRAEASGEAKWAVISEVRQCYLEMHGHFLRQKEELALTVDELADLEALYDALLRVRPRRDGAPAGTTAEATPVGKARPRKQSRPRKEAPEPPEQPTEPGPEEANGG